MIGIATKAITTDPSLSCMSSQPVHSQYNCRWAGGEHTHAQRELSQKVSKLPAGTGSLQKVQHTHGWDIPVGKNLPAPG